MSRAKPNKAYFPLGIALPFILDEDTKNDLLEILECPKAAKVEAVKAIEQVLTWFPEFLETELTRPTDSQLSREVSSLIKKVRPLKKALAELSPMATMALVDAADPRHKDNLNVLELSLLYLLHDIGGANRALAPGVRQGRRMQGQALRWGVSALSVLYTRYRRKRNPLTPDSASLRADFIRIALRAPKLLPQPLRVTPKTINAILQQKAHTSSKK